MVKDSGDLTYDVGFKYLIKELKYYTAAILADLLDLEYEYVLQNMNYLDVELISDFDEKTVSDCIIEIDDKVVILEMNRNYYKRLYEYKIRYANHIYNTLFYKTEKNKKVYSERKIILVLINAFKRKKICEKDDFTRFDIKNKRERKLTEYMIYYEINLEKIKEIWYSEVTISKLEKRLLYILLTRENKDKIKKLIEGDEILMKVEKRRERFENGTLYLDIDPEEEKEAIMNEMYFDGVEDGHATGKKDGINLVATNMKKSGVPIEEIARYTGLSKQNILSL